MSYLVSTLPIILLIVLMLGVRLSGYKSALLTMVFAILLSIYAAKPLGIIPDAYARASIGELLLWSTLEGVLKAIFPIFLIILMAIFSYNIIVESGQIEVIKRQFTSLTDDKGILVLLLVWGFGGLLEGMAGFGTAVAIPAAILIGLGFKPMFSALVALLGNTVATGFGAVGVPITTLCNEAASNGVATIESIKEICGFAVIQLAPLFLLVPFAILMLTNRKSLLKNILLSIWVGALSFGTQLACAIYLGAETPAILGSIAAILALVVAARITAKGGNQGERVKFFSFDSFKAWAVYLLILLFILLSGPLCPSLNAFLKTHAVSRFMIPVLNNTFQFGWISNAALMLFLGTIVGGLIQGVPLKRQILVLARTVTSLKFTAVTILSLIALASVMNYTGMIASMATGLVVLTGKAYPFFAPLIGALGTFVTGSDTSSNILFAKLQVNVAQKLGLTGCHTYFGISGNETNWLVAANTTGATGGKMISPQSIAVATAACEIKNSDDRILRSAIPYALGYVAIGGLIIYFGGL